MLKTTLTAAAAIAAAASFASADLIISEVIDGTLAGGNPKFVEITNTGAADFTFADGGIIVQSNLSTDLDIDVDLTGITIVAGDSYVIQSASNDGETVFEDTYGFAADLYTPAFFSNGDDRYILADATDGMGVATNLVDIYGEIDVDGTGTVWDFLDGYSYRLPTAISSNGGVFDASEFFFGGVDSLETGDDVTETALILSLTTPGTHVFVPEPTSLALVGVAGLAALRRRRA